MANQRREKSEDLRKRHAEIKKRLLSLPLPERVIEEVRQARELGITVTASEAGDIARPIERRSRIDASPICATAASLSAHPAEACREHGIGTDLGARGAAAVLKKSPFTSIGLAASIRENLKALAKGDTEELVTKLSPQLELLKARGESPELIRQAKRAFAQAVFAAATPSKSKKGLGGAQNRG